MSRQDHIREFATAALNEGKVDYFIGWKQGYNSSEMVPAFVKDASEVAQLEWNPLCHHNLVTFLKRNLPGAAAEAKFGLCVKGCDSRTLVSLLQEELLDKEKLYVVGVPCDGIVDRRKLEKQLAAEIVAVEFPDHDKMLVTTGDGKTQELAQKEVLLDACGRCRYPNAIYANETAGPALEEPNREELAPDWSDLEDYENLSDDEKQALLERVFSTCVRCFACIHACPVCYCWDKCVNRARQPELVSQKVGTKENLFFQMIHMMHVAGRCSSCGACDRACPVEIPLHLLHRKINKELYDMFAFEAGANLDDKPVFQLFNIEADEQFGD